MCSMNVTIVCSEWRALWAISEQFVKFWLFIFFSGVCLSILTIINIEKVSHFNCMYMVPSISSWGYASRNTLQRKKVSEAKNFPRENYIFVQIFSRWSWTRLLYPLQFSCIYVQLSVIHLCHIVIKNRAIRPSFCFYFFLSFQLFSTTVLLDAIYHRPARCKQKEPCPSNDILPWLSLTHLQMSKFLPPFAYFPLLFRFPLFFHQNILIFNH